VDLRAQLNMYIDIKAQLTVQEDQNKSIQTSREELQTELTNASEYINDLEGKFYQSRVECLELLRQLKECENMCQDYLAQIENLQNYIIDLKSRIAVYIPVKNDKIDKKIAEYINNYPERQKLKIMFMRESEGVYQFGSKRVMVKIDNDKINIRVGGGFLSIDEFLDQYTPEELQKLERKDPMRRFNEKMSVSKSLQGHMVRDNSPSSPSKGKRAI
jgi:predicted RNase H-like nuclease (RuvC/YqgF family)